MKFIIINPELLRENIAPISKVQQIDEIDALADTIDDNLAKEVHVPIKLYLGTVSLIVFYCTTVFSNKIFVYY